jgi:hypothetical protein
MLESRQAFLAVFDIRLKWKRFPTGLPASRTGTAKLGVQLVKQVTISRGPHRGFP